GNVQLSAASGRDVFKLICAADGRPFVCAEAPELPPRARAVQEPLPAAAHADPTQAQQAGNEQLESVAALESADATLGEGG
ncbi:MAG: hypothetical protein ACRC1H_00190, partial [Caldilineaceae bacterium]